MKLMSPADVKLFGPFFLVWLGETMSIVGSSMGNFAISTHIYHTTGSITLYSLGALASTLPVSLCSLFAGGIVDRFGRKTIIIYGAMGAALGEIASVILVVLWDGPLETGALLATILLDSAADAMVVPAFFASVRMLLPEKNVPSATGAIQFGASFAMIVAPGIGGFLYGEFGIELVLAANVVTSLIAILLIAPVPFPPYNAESKGIPLLHDIRSTWSYITGQPGVLQLIAFVAACNWFGTYAVLLMTPLLLDRFDTQTLGTVLSSGGFAMLASSLLVSMLKSSRSNILLIYFSAVVFSLGLLMIASGRGIGMITIGYCLMLAVIPVLKSITQAIFTVKVDPDFQGRFFGMYRAITALTIPIADATDGTLTDTVMSVAGVGKIDAIHLIFLGLAAVFLVIALVGYLDKSMRGIGANQPATG